MSSQNIRIISGTERGRKIWGPKDMRIRPATGMIKEYMFNIVQTSISGARVLDLFAGTGNLGIEALSRGAASAVFVDTLPAALDLIRKNLALMPVMSAKTRILKIDALEFIEKPVIEDASFDLIFADPPFPYKRTAEIVNAIDASRLLTSEGIFIARYNRDIHPDLRLAYLKEAKYREIGDSMISVFIPLGPSR